MSPRVGPSEVALQWYDPEFGAVQSRKAKRGNSSYAIFEADKVTKGTIDEGTERGCPIVVIENDISKIIYTTWEVEDISTGRDVEYERSVHFPAIPPEKIRGWE